MKLSNLLFTIPFILLWAGCSEDTTEILNPEPNPLVTPTLPTEIGQHDLTVQWQGIDRTVLINIPDGYDESGAHSLIFFLHGGSGNAYAMMSGHGNFVAGTESANIILVAPQGTLTHSGSGYRWNSWDDDNTTDDVGFLAALMEWLTEGLAIDESRRFITGFSNGAAMSQRFAAEQPEMILAAAAVCHTTGYTYTPEKGGGRFDLPTPVLPISILTIRGGADQTIPPTKTPTNKGKIIDTPAEQVTFWLNASNCDNTDFTEETPETGVTTRRYETCDDNQVVHSWFSEALVHTWPNHPSQYGLNVNQIVLEFFMER